jgi:hypothetical protein
MAPEVDVRSSFEAALKGLEDPEVLGIAAASGRVLASQDRRTMPAHFKRYSRGAQSPGVILLREGTPIYFNPIRGEENAVGIQFFGNGWRINNRAIQVP